MIIHAGFPKCGSSSIFEAMKASLNQLIAQDIFVFNRTFDLPQEVGELQPPLWQLQEALRDSKKAEDLRERITHQITRSSPSHRLVLSSENLSSPSMARLFNGIDELCDVEMIFYFRPQIDWIPSGWKQWDLKDGLSLSEAIRVNVKQKKPHYLASVNAWKEAIPGIKITPRPFLRDQMAGGHPAYDFFDLLQIPIEHPELFQERVNPSMDYSLLHLLYRNNHKIFSDRHDNRAIRGLLSMLPDEYKKTNIQMVGQSEADFISNHFHNDNVSLAEHHMGMKHHEAQDFVRQHFHRTIQGPAYSEIPEDEVLNRASRILREITGKSGDPDLLLLELASPYIAKGSA